MERVIPFLCSYRIVFYVILVGGLEHEFYDFPYTGNVIIPTDELHHFFRGLGQPPTRTHRIHGVGIYANIKGVY